MRFPSLRLALCMLPMAALAEAPTFQVTLGGEVGKAAAIPWPVTQEALEKLGARPFA